MKETVTSDGTWKASGSLPLKKVGSGKQLHAMSWRQEKPAPICTMFLDFIVINLWLLSGYCLAIVWLIGVNPGDRCPWLKTYRYLSRVTKSLRTGQTGSHKRQADSLKASLFGCLWDLHRRKWHQAGSGNRMQQVELCSFRQCVWIL